MCEKRRLGIKLFVSLLLKCRYGKRMREMKNASERFRPQKDGGHASRNDNNNV